MHSVSAVGEQYVELLPRTGKGPSLKDGDVIPVDRTYVPPDINSLVAAANRGLYAIPRDNLKTVVDESYVAFGGLGPELSRLVKGTTDLAIDARKNLDALTILIDESKPVLDSQTESSDSVQAWAAQLGDHTSQLRNNDSALGGLLQKGGPAADQARQLFDRLNRRCRSCWPTWSVSARWGSPTGTTWKRCWWSCRRAQPTSKRSAWPTGTPNSLISVPTLSFNLNLNWPPACTTGFLPAQQQRAASFEDYPEPSEGRLLLPVAARLDAQCAWGAQLSV